MDETTTTIKNITPISPTKTPDVIPTVSATQVGATQPITIPSTTSDNLSGAVLSTSQQYQQEKEATAKESTAREEAKISDIENILTQLEGETSAQIAAEDTQGLPGFQKELSDKQREVELKQREYIQGLQAIQAKRGTAQEATIAETHLNRQRAIESLILSSELEAKRGNVTFAQSQADRAIKAKYQPLKDRLDTKIFVLNQIKGKAAEDRANALSAQKQRMEQEQKNELAIQNLAIEALKNGANQSTVDSITSSPDVNSAIKAAGSSLYSPTTDIVKLDNGNTIMVDKKTGKVIKNFGGAKQITDTNYVITQNALKNVYNGDAVSQISEVIKSSGAKPNQQMTDAINVISGVQQMVKDNPDFKFKGINPLIRLPGIIAGERALTNRSDIAAINLKVQQWASGASLTEQQTKQVAKLTPDKNDTDEVVKNKLNSLANYMMSQVSGQLSGQGVGFTADKIDYFAPTSEEKLKTMYKDPQMKSKIEQIIIQYPDATAEEILQIVE